MSIVTRYVPVPVKKKKDLQRQRAPSCMTTLLLVQSEIIERWENLNQGQIFPETISSARY